MDATEHPWAEAWQALSPLRRTVLHSRVVEREPLTTLADRLERSESETEDLVRTTVLAFRREVVLALGTGYDAECGSLVLRLTDSAGERLTRQERRALAVHGGSCAPCSSAVVALLELDTSLRDGLLHLVGTDLPTPAVPAPRAGGASTAAPGGPTGRKGRLRLALRQAG
jgi:hypothetical protein